MSQIRGKLSFRLHGFEDCFIVDSMPLVVLKLARSGISKICKEEFYTSPGKGFLCESRYAFLRLQITSSLISQWRMIKLKAELGIYSRSKFVGKINVSLILKEDRILEIEAVIINRQDVIHTF